MMKSRIQLVQFACLIGAVLSGCATRKAELHSVHGQTVEHWINELKRPEPKARITAIAALQSVGAADPAALPAIIRAVSDSDTKVRDAAIIALLNIGPAANDAADALTKAKNDRDATIRSHAEAALQRVVPN